MSDKVIKQQSFQDRKVVLYQLENRPKKFWMARIRVPGGKGYIYRGTGSPDLYQAGKYADDLLDGLKVKVSLGRGGCPNR